MTISHSAPSRAKTHSKASRISARSDKTPSIDPTPLELLRVTADAWRDAEPPTKGDDPRVLVWRALEALMLLVQHIGTTRGNGVAAAARALDASAASSARSKPQDAVGVVVSPRKRAHDALGLSERVMLNDRGGASVADLLANTHAWRDGDVVSSSLRGVADDLQALEAVNGSSTAEVGTEVINSLLYTAGLRVKAAAELHDRIAAALAREGAQ
jgi:hypothetical protein